MANPTDAQQRARRAATQEERARNAVVALQEVEAERKATAAKTARLRALRKARDAEQE